LTFLRTFGIEITFSRGGRPHRDEVVSLGSVLG